MKNKVKDRATDVGALPPQGMHPVLELVKDSSSTYYKWVAVFKPCLIIVSILLLAAVTVAAVDKMPAPDYRYITSVPGLSHSTVHHSIQQVFAKQ